MINYYSLVLIMICPTTLPGLCAGELDIKFSFRLSCHSIRSGVSAFYIVGPKRLAFRLILIYGVSHRIEKYQTASFSIYTYFYDQTYEFLLVFVHYQTDE